ncbi:hypothetical protein [Sphingomonas glacialis]|uniref:Uncharacterized protein n=1 Tax=Sphingomonas glacialis TaxID=658225 RepID=A0A502FZA7_9SPHN|nr:hypothetical protein [Sphingomonas glacialis]TPG54967.1 hypothetical protein EAH76_10280 [Sphingomonas glacialis]
MTKLLILATSALSILSSPVIAREARPAATGVAVPIDAASPTATQRQSNPRYCIVETITGSRIPHKTCRTRAQWIDEGFDPLAKN